MWRDRLERVLAAEYLGDLDGRSVDELRALRDECRAVGDDLSFLRRQVHGRLDIVRWELARRAAGEGPSSLEELIPKLDDILSSNVHAPGHTQMVENVEPPDLDELTEELDSLVPPTWGLIELDDEALRGWAAKLQELEEGYSRPRREVFQREDAVKDVLTDRLGEQPPAVPAE
ncbi:MAG TPA: hypothetical protein VG455_11620 [Acidimicrobiales bacterium]|nr:hypothetical protein [Acidimicrobiales bacterium]